MNQMTDDELEDVLHDRESDRVERKETLRGDAPRTVREAVCAFANDLPDHRRPGVVFVGARDDGEPSNLPITDDLLRQLADLKTDGGMVPPPSLTVSQRRLRGAEMAVVVVQPADSPPVRYRGRIFIRTGPRRDVATAQDERILNEKRRHRDQPFDARPASGASLEDVDRRFFEEVYLPAAFAPEVLEQNDRSFEQRMAATKMATAADDPAPTNLALLVLGSKARAFLPGAYVQFLRIAGNSLADPVVDEQAIEGPVATVLQRCDDKMVSHNRIAVDFTSGAVEKRTVLYPLPALQQLVRNAVLHRTYEATHSPVRVNWFDDRIDIISPGGPFGAVNRENFGQPGLTDYRNPNLAEALRVLGLIQRFGAGIPTARRELQSNGNPPPEFDVQTGFVTVTVRPQT